MRSAHAFPALMAGSLAGCSGIQSAWAPAGPDAQSVVTLGNVMFIGGALILALVIGLTAIAILAPPERRRWLAGRRAVIWGGIVFPSVTVTALLVYGLSVMATTPRAARGPALSIEVSGERWWWRVRYLDETGDGEFQRVVQHRRQMMYPSVAKQRTVLPCQDILTSRPRRETGLPV